MLQMERIFPFAFYTQKQLFSRSAQGGGGWVQRGNLSHAPRQNLCIQTLGATQNCSTVIKKIKMTSTKDAARNPQPPFIIWANLTSRLAL